ncbi:MAG: hypothetical protein K6E65_06960 [Olsenella sp.]|nr:hypothetical protein [Olsenella sp.]
MDSQKLRHGSIVLVIVLWSLIAWIFVRTLPPRNFSNAHLDYVSGTVVSVEPEARALSIQVSGMDSDCTFSEDPMRFVFRSSEEFYASDVGQEVTIGYIHGDVGEEGARPGYCIDFKTSQSPAARTPELAEARNISPSPVFSCEGTIDSIDVENSIVTIAVSAPSPNAEDIGITAGNSYSFDLSAWTMRQNLATYHDGDSVDVWFSNQVNGDGLYKAWCAQPTSVTEYPPCLKNITPR